jgi:invasion protein IalB
MNRSLVAVRPVAVAMRSSGNDWKTMRGLISILAGVALAATGSAALAQAQAQAGKSAVKVSVHGDWGTYAYTDKNAKVCYVLSQALKDKMEPKTLDHGAIYFTVSQKPSKNVQFEPQFITSYDMQENSKPVVTIGDKSFEMFIRGNYAWVANAAEEPIMIAAMKAGHEMKVAAKSKRGNDTSYVFSLKGISAALDSIAGCK